MHYYKIQAEACIRRVLRCLRNLTKTTHKRQHEDMELVPLCDFVVIDVVPERKGW